ncbi:hypothetical protein J6590_025464 [Homalodisca vitripennis]|nr:hypothetical protein J6590_025464 [Homalodisca vitripennis]
MRRLVNIYETKGSQDEFPEVARNWPAAKNSNEYSAVSKKRMKPSQKTARDSIPDNNKRDNRIAQRTKGSSGNFRREREQLLIDTGANMTPVYPSVINDRGQYIQQPRRSGPQQEETAATFLIDGDYFQRRALVDNIKEDVILGMDFLSIFELELDFKKNVVTIGGEEVILHSGNNCTAYAQLVSYVIITRKKPNCKKGWSRGGNRLRNSVILEPKSDDEKLCHGVVVAITLFLTGESSLYS